MRSNNPGTVVFESGLASPPVVWRPVAQALELEFRAVIHQRAVGGGSLAELAKEWRLALHRAAIAPPYLLVAHSFGALTARQFAAAYPRQTAGIVFVDGLPAATRIPAGKLRRAVAFAKAGQLLAALRITERLLPWAARHVTAVRWAVSELSKLPAADQLAIRAEWAVPAFYGSLASTLQWLPANLRAARSLSLPNALPTVSLYSDYPDPDGRRVDHAGHWIQVDQPQSVIAAIREVAAEAWHNRESRGV